MRRMILAMAIVMLAGSTASATCKSDAAAKKLAGAALNSFLTKCESDAKAKCETESTQRKLAGAAKESHMKKCVLDTMGQ